jgi:hypothetical protein
MVLVTAATVVLVETVALVVTEVASNA